MVSLDETRVRRCADPILSAANDVFRTKTGTPAVRSAAIVQLIEADIIPRLLVANRSSDERARTAAIDADAADIEDFARMMVALDLARANLVVAGASARGVSVENLMLGLFAPTARRLGEMWVEDLCTFTDVTVGLCTLQSLLRSIASGDAPAPQARHDGRILVAAAPQEQHSFGVLMLEAFFRRAGWDVVGLPLATRDEVLASVARREFAIVGFSLSRDAGVADLADLGAATRRASRNPDVAIMVGGRVFNDRPDLSRSVGADLTAEDADQALVASHRLLCSRVQTH